MKTSLLCSALACLLAGCSNGNKAGTVKIDGSSTVLPISEAVAEDFGTESGVRVTVSSSGTGGGMQKFIAGDIDICDASRPIKSVEIEACKENNIEYIELEIAFDGLAVVVNAENDWCSSLTVAQLQSIWEPGSTVQKWSDLDPAWPAEKINLYGPDTQSGTFDYFTKTINGEEGATRPDYNANTDDNFLVTGVTGDKNALAYFGYSYYYANKEKLNILGIDGGNGPITPNETTVQDGTYAPLSRPLYIYVRKAALERPEVVAFVKYYLEHANEMAESVDYVAISDEAAKKNEAALKEALGE